MACLGWPVTASENRGGVNGGSPRKRRCSCRHGFTVGDGERGAWNVGEVARARMRLPTLRGPCGRWRAGEGDDKHGKQHGLGMGHGVEGATAPCRASAWPWARRVARDRSTEGPGVVVVPGGGRSVRRRSSAAWEWPSARRANTSASRARSKAPSRVGHGPPHRDSTRSQRARWWASAAHDLRRAGFIGRGGRGGRVVP